MARKTTSDVPTPETTDEPVAPEALDFPGQVATPEMTEAKALANANRFTDEELRNITSFDDALALAQSVYGEITDITEELGNGFTLISDKSPLVDNPFVIVSCAFNDGDFGSFASVAAVTKDGKKYIFNDGSTGVHNQLFELARTKKRTGGFMAPSGLTASEYDTCPPGDGGCSRARPNAVKTCTHCGNTSERRSTSTTYFLNLTPAAS
jgi:hypothetical protein